MPTARVLHEAPDLLGGPFSVSDYVPGRGVQTRDDLDVLNSADVALVSTHLVETLVALHQVDHVAVGLEDFGRSDGYVQRQLRRWTAQWELVGDPALTAQSRWVSSRLAELVPPQRATSIVHGDFRIDNTILAPGESGPAGLRIAAVVDWELSTIGDPIADVATMCAYRDVAFDLIVGAPSAWASPTAIAAGYVATDISAWISDSILSDTMLQVSDVVTVVRMLLELGRTASVPQIVMSRSGASAYRA